MHRKLIVAALLLVGFAGPALAQVKLVQKIPDGSRLTITSKNAVQQSLTLNGMVFDTKSKQTMVLKTVAGKRAADGTIRVTGKIESMKAEFVLPGGVELKFDSSKEVEPQGTQFDVILDVMNAISKAKWTTEYGKDNRVQKIEGWDKVAESLDETQRKLIEEQTDQDYLKEVANEEIDSVPPMSLKVGDTWRREFTLRLTAGQRLSFKNTYKYEGVIDVKGAKLDKINFQATAIEYSVENNPDVPLAVKKSDLKIDSSEGLILFDRAKGRVVQRTEKTRIKGALTLVIGEKELAGKLDLLFDKNTTTSSP